MSIFNRRVPDRKYSILAVGFPTCRHGLKYYRIDELVKTATNQNGDMPKRQHQNGDRLPRPIRRQTKRATSLKLNTPKPECSSCNRCIVWTSIASRFVGRFRSSYQRSLKTASKSTHKPRRNICLTYAPVKWRTLRLRSVTKRKKNIQTPHFRTYSWHM